ncbi:MAG: hypothetical protein HQL06_03670 [Nitrospirae bacterium]|nr:hypothetical protein [Nitrospirota bacterium]
MILYDIEHFVYSPFHDIFITTNLMLLCIKNIVYLNLPRINSPMKFLGEIFKVYVLSLIEYIDPSVVITFYDDSILFQRISRLYKKAEFYAIQNGLRQKYNFENWYPKDYQFSMPHFFCFGKLYTDMYRDLNYKIDNFYCIGSLRAGYYMTEISKNKRQNTRFDICIIAEFYPLDRELDEENWRGVQGIGRLMRKYVDEHQLSYCLALRWDSNRKEYIEEQKYFKNLYEDKVTFIEHSRFSVYEAIDKSDLVVAFYSTSAIEALGYGKKVFLCNTSGHSGLNMPINNICSLNELDYDKFKEKLNYIRYMDYNNYLEIIQKDREYLMNFDQQNPPHIFIRSMVNDVLGTKK